MKRPWWFGLPDVSVSAFGVVWLVFVSVMGVLLATGSAGYLFLVPFAAFGAHLAVGRLVHRRMRIRRSTHVLTDRRLITAWRLREPTVVQADLVALLPPLARGVTVFTQPARAVVSRRGEGWKMLARPTATTGPPALVGITDPQAVRDLICAAQLAARHATWQEHAGN